MCYITIEILMYIIATVALMELNISYDFFYM
jgi:hypothetical protein